MTLVPFYRSIDIAKRVGEPTLQELRSQTFYVFDQRRSACFYYFWLPVNMAEMLVSAYCKIEKKH